jgi:peptide/nickel transport system permease protein
MVEGYKTSRQSKRTVSLAIGVSVAVVVLTCALFAPWLAPHVPTESSLQARLLAPGQDLRYPLGTDLLGRDMVSRLMFGARVSLGVSVASLLLAAAIGVSLGVLAGTYPRVRRLLDKLVDIWQAIPYLLVALAVAATLGASFVNVVVVLGITTWVLFYRVVRIEVQRMQQLEFVLAATALGASTWRIVWRYLLPNIIPVIIPVATLLLANLIIFEASLSFLGLGVPPPAVSWGAMAASGRGYEAIAWWVPLFPGVAIFVTVLGFNLLGDSLRDYLDPRQRHDERST